MNRRTFVGTAVAALSVLTCGYLGRPAVRRVFRTVRSGHWNDPTIWDRNEVPGLNDAAFVGSGNSVDIPGDTLTERSKCLKRGEYGVVIERAGCLDVLPRVT
jgi:hypothetical protein